MKCKLTEKQKAELFDTLICHATSVMENSSMEMIRLKEINLVSYYEIKSHVRFFLRTIEIELKSYADKTEKTRNGND